LVVPLLVATVAGCGSEDRGSDEAQIRAAVRAYIEAFAEGDGEKACDQFTGPGKRELVAYASDQLPAPGGNSCEDLVAQASDLLGDEERKLLKQRVADDKNVRVTREGARAQVVITGSPQAPRLAKVDSDWRVDSLGLEGAKSAIDCVREAGVKVEDIDPDADLGAPDGVDEVLAGGSGEGIQVITNGAIEAVLLSFDTPQTATQKADEARANQRLAYFIKEPDRQIRQIDRSVLIVYRDGADVPALERCMRNPGI